VKVFILEDLQCFADSQDVICGQAEKNAICKFCDTDFRGTDGENGGKYTAEELTVKLIELWPNSEKPFVVFTGGEPALQLDDILLENLKAADIETAIETNGTLPLPEGIDWICMSPKANTEIVVTKGHEIKIVYPQKGIEPLDFVGLDFEHFYIQPMESEAWDENTRAAIEFCKQNPQFKLSLQTHKYLNIP